LLKLLKKRPRLRGRREGSCGASDSLTIISDDGDDANDGFTLRTPVYSWKQACKLKGGDNSIDMHLIGGAAERIRNEIAKKEKKKAKK